MLGSIQKFLFALIGTKVKGYLVITNKRVIEVTEQKACWVFNVGKNIRYVLPSSGKEIGYTKEGTVCGCLCQAYHLYYNAFTQRTSVMLNVTDESEAQNVVDAFYKTISK